MSEIDLDAMEARAEAASEGPWEPRADGDITRGHGPDGLIRRVVRDTYGDGYAGTACDAADAEFIAHARTDIPALIVRVRELEMLVERVKAAAQDWEDDDDAYLVKHGQHLPGSVARMAELLRAAIEGNRA